jgi:hypothetical protein
MSMQVLPTAPSPTVTHLMNREALDAMAEPKGFWQTRRWMQGTTRCERWRVRSVFLCCLVWLWLLDEVKAADWARGEVRNVMGHMLHLYICPVLSLWQVSLLLARVPSRSPFYFAVLVLPLFQSLDNGLLGSESSAVFVEFFFRVFFREHGWARVSLRRD